MKKKPLEIVLIVLCAVLLVIAMRGQHWFRAAIMTLVLLMLISPAFQKTWGGFMSRLILTVLYAALLPFGLVYGLFNDPLRLQGGGRRDSHWISRPAEDESLHEAAKQG